MTTNSNSSSEYVRRGLLKIDDATVLGAVDKLQLRGNAKVSAVVGMPLRTLQQRRDVSAFAASAPIAAVQALMELLAMEPLERVIEQLGDHADSPTYEQLAQAVDRMVAKGTSNDDIVALLTHAIGEEFPASAHCRQLLDVRPLFRLPSLPSIVTTTSLLVPKEVDGDVRAQRLARREAQKEQKKNKKATVLPRSPGSSKLKGRKTTETIVPATKLTSINVVTSVERRSVKLTPSEREEFSSDHPLAGTVVIAEIPFDSVDETTPEMKSKERPALVVAASDAGLLLRGIYSSPSVTRALFSPWRRLKMDHASYVDVERIAVRDLDLDLVVRLGRVTDVEWNQLI